MTSGWLDLRRAAEYCCLSVRTLRTYIGHAEHPLPVHLAGGKWVVKISELDQWLASFPKAGERADRIVEKLMEELENAKR